MAKVIDQLLVDGLGWRYRKDGPIVLYPVPGEMSMVSWYRQTYPDGTTSEYNGKYIIAIDWCPLPDAKKED